MLFQQELPLDAKSITMSPPLLPSLALPLLVSQASDLLPAFIRLIHLPPSVGSTHHRRDYLSCDDVTLPEGGQTAR